MNRLPPLNAVKSFEAAARLGSFQRAAGELFVTPSAISHQIKTLEEFLGVELFIRATRQIMLTQAGEDYFESVQKALLEIDSATQRLIASHQAGQLHLSVAPAFLTRWLLPRISSFYEAHPDIEIEISSTAGLIDFARSETDMAVYFGDGNWNDVEKQLLRRYRQVAVCSPKLLKDDVINEPADVMRYPLLHVNKRSTEWAAWFSQAGVTLREAKRGMYFSSGALTTSAAINGLGFALADPGFVMEEINTNKLVVPLEHHLKTNRSFYLVYQKKRVLTYTMAAFQGWIMDEMSKDVWSPEAD